MIKILFLSFVALVGLAFLLFFAVPSLHSSYPELFGQHPDFYRTCKSLEPGMPMAEARAAMADYLEVGRTWHPPASMPGGLFEAVVVNVRESEAEHRTRLTGASSTRATKPFSVSRSLRISAPSTGRLDALRGVAV